jgi:hypothetical protein
MNKLEWALSHARRGLPVFPLNDQCEPDIVGWPEKATTDEEQIRRWWTDPVLDWPIDRNIGIATGNGILAVDLDNKKGKDGSGTFALLEDIQGEAPPTLKTRTPSGGYHLFFKVDATYANSVEKIGPGIDTRGHRGYVVAAGSERADGAYELIEDTAIAPAPGWITAKLEAPRERAEPSEIVTELDTPYAMMRAIRWLQDAPAAVEGQGGDRATFGVAAKLKDFGLSRGAAVQAMLEFWNERCSPPWHPRELEQKVVNAYRYGTSAPAVLDPTREFEPVVTATKERGLYFVRFEDAKPDTAAPYLIQGLLDQGAMSVLYGDSNSGKTFIALDLSHCIATGREWRGKRVKQGLVVYVAAEGGRSIQKRLTALRARYGAQDVALVLVPCPVDLLHAKGDTAGLVQLIAQVEADYGQRASLIVVDTLSRALAGGNENAPDDMGALVANLDRIRAATQAHILVVHHSGKDAARGARGHSLLRAAIDTEIEVGDKSFSVTKQRDGEYGPAARFDLEVVTVGSSDEAIAITSCLVKWADAGETLDRDRQELKDAMDAFDQAQLDEARAKYGSDFTREQLLTTPISTTVWVTLFAQKRGLKMWTPGHQRDSRAYKRLKEVAAECGRRMWTRKINSRQWVRGNVDVVV